MIKSIITVFMAFLSIFKWPLIILGIIISIFYLLVGLNITIQLIKGKRFKKGTRRYVKKPGFFKKIFIDLPKRYTKDIMDKDPDFFKYQGLIIYEGRQGSGKTSTMVHDTMLIQEEYPKAKCTTNLAYTKEDKPLEDWRQLLTFKNGIYGVIVLMDELQNWFSSNDSRNFPPDMLQVITQNRKNRRVLFGTSQNFYLLAKPIRSQCTEVRQCLTLLGCLTFVRRRQPILDSEGNVVKWKNRGIYFYVHDDKLRESYDTFKVIERLAKVGFQEKKEETNNNIYIMQNTKEKNKPALGLQ